jgi:hypothetical protein
MYNSNNAFGHTKLGILRKCKVTQAMKTHGELEVKLHKLFSMWCLFSMPNLFSKGKHYLRTLHKILARIVEGAPTLDAA